MRKIILGLVIVLTGLLAAPTTAPAIVNGSDAATNPGAVSLWTDNPNRNRCTGTLIDDKQGHPNKTRWVFTAAHCVYSFTAPGAGDTTARIGGTDNTTGNGEYAEIKVVPGQFWYNPAFDPNTLAYDGMLMLLENETPLTAPDGDPVQVMKWEKPSLPLGAVTQAYGYGWVCDGPPGQTCSSWYQGPLQTMVAKTVNDPSCYAIVASQVCFSHITNSKTMGCLGDSGAPLKSPDFDGSPILRLSVIGDGDQNYDSCTEGLDGAPGRGVALDIGQPDIQQWMNNVLAGTARQHRTSLPPATPRILQMTS